MLFRSFVGLGILSFRTFVFKFFLIMYFVNRSFVATPLGIYLFLMRALMKLMFLGL